MHSLGMLYYEIASVTIINSSTETRLYLLRNVEVIEYWHLAGILLHYVCLVRGNEIDIMTYSGINLVIVDVDILV